MERIGGFGGKSDLLARCQTYRGNPDCYKDYLKWVKAATPATVKKAANDWLSDGDYVLEVHPYPTTFKTEAQARPLERAARGRADVAEAAADAEGHADQRAEGRAGGAPHGSRGELHADGGQRIFRRSGRAQPGTASFEQRMLEEGTPTRDSLKIGEELEALSANFTATAQPGLRPGQPEHAQEHDGSVAGYLCGPDSASGISAEGIRAPAERAPGRHSAREGDSPVDGAARGPDTALRRGTSVCGAVHRDRHRSQRRAR